MITPFFKCIIYLVKQQQQIIESEVKHGRKKRNY